MKRKSWRITRAQMLLILLMLAYAVVSLIGLGDSAVPQTQPDMGQGEARSCIAYAAFPASYELESLMIYKGLGTCGVTVYIPDESGENWIEATRKVCDSIYAWEEIPLDCTAQIVCISVGADAHAELFEAGFLTADRSVVPVLSEDSALFDEQGLVPSMATYRNGTYFDEVYHARTAYEYLQSVSPYETSHPPLGKLLIACGIAVFGMNPFGWRIAGCLCGIAMIPVLYWIAKYLFGDERKALLAVALLSFDFMHFTQSRIALIDAPAVLLIMLMYALMYRYYNSTTQELPYPRALHQLAVCGVVLGFGISVKWTAVYAALGLAVLFLIALIRRHKQGESAFRTCLWCVLFFGVIPMTIYFLSYIPYYIADPATPAWKIFLENQIYMLTYHSGLDAVHTFSSPWYTWPLILRPMWYYGAKALAADGLTSSIVAMGNPIVWWCGTLCAVLLLFKRKKTRADVFILIGFSSQYLPWALISRISFIYHYFAAVPFIILALISVLGSAERYHLHFKRVAAVLLIGSAVLFVMFYPVLSGYTIDRSYVMQALTWFPQWILGY